MFPLLADGLPLLHSQAIYIKALELEIKDLLSKVDKFSDIEEKYRSEVEEITYKYEKIVKSQLITTSLSENEHQIKPASVSYSDQVVSIHALRTKMEIEQEENQRLVQIFRMQNEAVETKNFLLVS